MYHYENEMNLSHFDNNLGKKWVIISIYLDYCQNL